MKGNPMLKINLLQKQDIEPIAQINMTEVTVSFVAVMIIVATIGYGVHFAIELFK